MIILQAKGITKSVSTPRGILPILKSVDFSVNHSEKVAILGPSGSGKTTLLGILAGLDLPTQGQVIIQEQNLNQMNEEQRAAFRLDNIGFVFQNFELLPHLNALENVMLPLELAGHQEAKSRAQNILIELGLEERWGHYPLELSGGEQQRVALARAYVINPKILFADEPTGSLDESTGEKIMSQLFSLNEKFGTTLIFVTHDQNLAEQCNLLYHLEKGHLTLKSS